MSIKILSLLKVIQSSVMVTVITLAMTLFAPAASAQVVGQASDFNHMSTGFPLTGVHTNVECETCHVGGIFKGTPKDCAGCHSAGRRVVAPGKHATHIITNAPCESCHTNNVTFLGARFDHIGVQPKACTTCHAGVTAPGKPGGHVSTNAACDTCHRTSAWLPAGYNHVGVFPGSCKTCHGVTAQGMGAAHVVTTASCDSCHYTTSWIYNHLGVTPNTCASCHGVTARGKPPNHIPTTITDPRHCDTCHLSTTSWTSQRMNHNGSVTGCKTCHNSGTPYAGSMDKKTLGNHEGSKTTDDCSQSGCHRPLGSEGTSWVKWN